MLLRNCCNKDTPDYKSLYEMEEFRNELQRCKITELQKELSQARRDYQEMLGCRVERKQPWRDLTLNQLQTIAMTNRDSQINLACDVQYMLKCLNS